MVLSSQAFLKESCFNGPQLLKQNGSLTKITTELLSKRVSPNETDVGKIDRSNAPPTALKIRQVYFYGLRMKANLTQFQTLFSSSKQTYQEDVLSQWLRCECLTRFVASDCMNHSQ